MHAPKHMKVILMLCTLIGVGFRPIRMRQSHLCSYCIWLRWNCYKSMLQPLGAMNPIAVQRVHASVGGGQSMRSHMHDKQSHEHAQEKGCRVLLNDSSDDPTPSRIFPVAPLMYEV